MRPDLASSESKGQGEMAPKIKRGLLGKGYFLQRFIRKLMNATLVKQALEKVLNPNVLVNLISRRVRQLNSGGGGASRPLIADVANLGAADIALTEIIEGKMGWEMPEIIALTRPTGKGRKRPQHWAKLKQRHEAVGLPHQAETTVQPLRDHDSQPH